MRDPRSLGAAGIGPMAGQFGQFKTMQGNPMFAGSPVQGQTFTGMNAMQALSQAQRAHAAWAAAQQHVGGILGVAHPAVDQEMSLPTYDPTIEPVSAPPSMPNVFNQDWLNKIANFRATMLSRNRATATPAPDPLANDLTRFAKPNGRPINAVGMQGGLGAQSYSTSRDPHYGWR